MNIKNDVFTKNKVKNYIKTKFCPLIPTFSFYSLRFRNVKSKYIREYLDERKD